MRSPHLHDTLQRFCLGAFAVFVGELEDGARSRSPSRSTAPTAGRRSTSTARSCAASSRRAPSGFRAARRADAVADLQREPAARIFARAHDGARATRARALPQRARPASRAHRRGLRRLRLGRLRFRARVRRARGLALRRRPLLRRGRAADRPLRRHADRARRRDPRARWPPRGARGDVARGGGVAAARLRPRARPDLRARARALARRRRRRGARRAGRARRRGHGDPARHRGAGRRRARPVRAARLAARTGSALCSRSRRRRRPASRRGSIPSAPRSRATCACASLSPTTTRSSATRSTAGSWRSSSPIRFAREQLRHALEAALGEGDGAWAAAMRGAALLGGTPAERADLAEKLREPTCELVRRLLVAVLLHDDRRALVRDLDEALLGATGAVASLQRRAS